MCEDTGPVIVTLVLSVVLDGGVLAPLLSMRGFDYQVFYCCTLLSGNSNLTLEPSLPMRETTVPEPPPALAGDSHDAGRRRLVRGWREEVSGGEPL